LKKNANATGTQVRPVTIPDRPASSAMTPTVPSSVSEYSTLEPENRSASEERLIRSSFDPAAAFRRHWWLPLGGAVLGALLALVFSALQPERYRASAIVAVAPASGINVTDLLRSIDALDRRTMVATVAELAVTAPVRTSAGIDAATESDYRIDARVIPNTSLVRIIVEGSDPARAREIANQVPLVLSAQTRQLFQVYDVQTVAAAQVAPGGGAPASARSSAAGLVAGLLLGALLALGMQLINRTSP
jgi:capsular polysaccharide biosynthesis protein